MVEPKWRPDLDWKVLHPDGYREKDADAGDGDRALCGRAAVLTKAACDVLETRDWEKDDPLVFHLALIAAILDLTEAVREVQETVQAFVWMDDPDHAPVDG